MPPGGSRDLEYLSQLLCGEKSLKTANNSATVETGEKISTDLESLEFCKCVDVRSAKFKNNEILLHKINHQFRLKTKLFSV